MKWSTDTIEELLQRAGTKHLQQLVAMPSGQLRLDTLMQTCKDCALTVPEKVAKDASRIATKGAQLLRDRKKQVVEINPANYKLELTFLRNEDGTAPRQLSTLTATSSGIALMDLQQAMPWIRENRVLSHDELTLAVVGHHQLKTSLKHVHCTLPCLDQNDRPVILAITLCQLGEKQILPVASEHHVAVEPCQTMAFTLWREDWTDSEWKKASEQTIPFVRQLLAVNRLDASVEALWGRSIRGSTKDATTNFHAQSIQLHAAVKVDKVAELLKHTGFNRLWAIPKTDQGRIDPNWKVIWVEGDLAHLTSLAAQTKQCAGLVRNKSTRGLRFLKEHFSEAWQVIHGTKPQPLDVTVKHTFRLEPLPFGCTGEMLVAWSKLLPWEFKPIKAIGPRTWLIGSASMPPDGVHSFNSSPVLIKLIQPKGSTAINPVLAGPKPSKHDAKKTGAEDPFYDPWAASAYALRADPAKGASADARTIQGPIETRFAAQDARFDQLEKTIATMKSNAEQLTQETKQGFDAVQQREQQLQNSIMQVRTDLESSFQAAIAQQSTQMSANFEDLKVLLASRNKRKTGEDSDMES
eukprot:Skav229478  [mRNA]  locus=scaffold3730:3999:5738:- [translate_table: standard]